MEVLKQTDFRFAGQKNVYHGKVRDVYNINDDYMVMVATDASRRSMLSSPKGSLTRDKCSIR